MSAWKHDGSRVFNGSAPTSWTDLDLKAVAGGGATTHPTARTLAVLKVLPSTSISYTGFRPDGSSIDTLIGYTNGHGCCSISPPHSPADATIVVVPTSSSGLVEWRATSAGSVEIWLMGFVEAAIADDIVRADSAMPSTWTTLDLTEDTGASPTGLTGEALAFLWVERTGGTTNNCATRPVVYGIAGYLEDSSTDGASQGRPHALNEVEGYLQKTNSSGEIEIIAEATVPNTEITLASFEQASWTNSNSVEYASAAPPTSWQDLDLSGTIGAKRALVLLEIAGGSASPGTYIRIAVRPDGDTDDYLASSSNAPMGCATCVLDADHATALVVETSSSGVIEWIANSSSRDIGVRLLGYLLEDDPPVISSALPTGTVVPETQISFSTSDDNSSPSSTIDLEVTFPGDSVATDIIVNGVFQSPYTGTISANGSNGYDVTVNAIPMPVGSYSATAYCEDDAAQSDTEIWTWTVASTQDPPSLSAQSPASIMLSSSDSIQCQLQDYYGFDMSTLVIQAIPCVGTAMTIYTGSAWQTGWSGTIGQSGGAYGANPTRVSITVSELHEDFVASSPKRWTIDVSVDTIAGETL